MSMFLLDKELCTGCGICSQVCSAGIIGLENQHSFPYIRSVVNKGCINCGHCLSACPQGAISLKKMPLNQCPPVTEGWWLSPEKVEQLYRKRRSIRIFKDEPVPRETLNKIINISRYAPSSHNSQTVHWVVVYQPEEMGRVRGMIIDFLRYLQKKEPSFTKMLLADQVLTDYDSGVDSVCRDAPHIILTHVPLKGMQTGVIVMPDKMADGTIATTYLELALPSFGLGGCWAGYIMAAASAWPPLRNALGIPKSHITTGAILVGYPQYTHHRLPLRNDPVIKWV